MTLSPGILLNNRYRIESILGQGGMGSVYRAQDENLGVFVAVKENLFLSEDYARQFQREANILASLRHHSLPHVVDYFYISGQGQYLIMEFIEGEDLRQRIERLGALSEREVVIIGAHCCNALTYLHTRAQGIVHRDIKPGNIKVTTDGDIVLVDFGLAKVLDRDHQATTTGARAMTPGYSPPEQYGTARTDTRTDIYALGATLYAALTGTIPEDGLSRATGKAKLTPIRILQPKVSRRVASVIEKALEIEPDDRYQTAEEFKQAILAASDLTIHTIEKLNVDFQPEVGEPQSGPLKTNFTQNNDEPVVSKWSKSDRKFNFHYFLEKRWYILAGLLVVILAGVGLQIINRIDMINTTLSGQKNITAIPTLQPTKSNMLIPGSILKITPTRETPQPEVPLLPTIRPPTLQSKTGPTPQGGGRGKIAFVSDRTNTMQIWLMNIDGSSQTQFTNVDLGACQPNWSPDGKRMAFISPCKKLDKYDQANIYIIDTTVDNAKPVKLMSDSPGGDFDPAWSPDGNRIAFTSWRNGNGKPHIFLYNFVNSAIEELSDTPNADRQPSWNPSGKQLAFVRDINFYHVFIMSDKGLTQFQNFSSIGPTDDSYPQWSPDSKFIIFSRFSSSGIPYLYMLRYEDRGTGGEVRIPPPSEADFGPIAGAHISPDGNWIVYESWPDGRNHDIFLMSIQGKDRIRLTTDPGSDFEPAWQPVSVP